MTDKRDDSTMYDNLYVRCVFYATQLFNPERKASYKLFLQYLLEVQLTVPLAPTDCMVLMETTRLFIPIMFAINRNITFQEFKDRMVKRWVFGDPKLRCVLKKVCFRTCWCPLKHQFDYRNHIIQLPDRDNDDYHSLVKECMQVPMDPDQPQWKIIFVRMHSFSLAFFKIDHTIADGSSVMMFIVNKLGDEPLDFNKLPGKYRIRAPLWQRGAYYSCFFLTSLLMGFWDCTVSLRTSAVSNTIIGGQEFDKDEDKRTNRFFSEYNEISLEDMKLFQIKTNELLKKSNYKTRVTINDVFLYLLSVSCSKLRLLCTEGNFLRSALINYKNNNQTPLNDNDDDENIAPTRNTPSARSNVPYSFERSDIAVSECDRKFKLPKELRRGIIPIMSRTSIPSKLNNETSTVLFNLPIPEYSMEYKSLTDERTEFISSILEIVDQTTKLKDNYKGIRLYCTMLLLSGALPISLCRRLYNVIYRHTQFSCTNVASPAVDTSFSGFPVKQLIIWPAAYENSNIATALITVGDVCKITSVLSSAEITSVKKTALKLLASSCSLEERLELDLRIEKLVPNLVFEYIKNELVRKLELFETV